MPAGGNASSLRNASISEVFREFMLPLTASVRRLRCLLHNSRYGIGVCFLRSYNRRFQRHLRLFINDDRREPRTGTGHVSSTALNALNVLLLLLPTSPANSHLEGSRVGNLFVVCGLELQKNTHLLIRLVSALPVTVDLKAPYKKRGFQFRKRF